DVFADLQSHASADARREAIVEARPDTRVGDLLGKGFQVGPAVSHARRHRTGHGDLGDVRGPEHRLDHTRDAAAKDAMRTRIFRVHRRVVDRLPGRLAIGLRVVVDVAIANGGDRAPEV